MIENLFNSKSRTDILNLYFTHPEQKFYVQEVTKLIEGDSANVFRELKNLERIGILIGQKKENRKYYRIDKESVYFDALRLLFKAYNDSRKGEWILLEEIPDYYPQAVASGLNAALANRYFKENKFDSRFSRTITVYKDGYCQLWLRKKEFDSLCKEVLNRLINNPKWGEDYILALENRRTKFIEKVKGLSQENLLKLTDGELKILYSNYYTDYANLHVMHWIQTAVDFGEGLLSDYLISYLRSRIKETEFTEFSDGDIFATLTTPIEAGNISKEHESLLDIIGYIQNHSDLQEYFKDTETRLIVKEIREKDSTLEDLIDSHAENFGWLGYGMIGPSWGKEYFVDVIASLIRQDIDPAKTLANSQQAKRELGHKQQELIHKLRINEKYSTLFDITRKLVFTKGTRKDAMFYFLSVFENAYREIGRRFYLNLQQVRYLMPPEVENLFEGVKVSADVLGDRYSHSIFESTGSFDDEKILVGDKAKKYISKINLKGEEVINSKILLGTCACPGRVRGEVKIINSARDIEKMNQGNVLVSCATNPDLVPAIKKAAAIVTDVGGITCHAAIISRELNIPCMVGSKFATKVLQDGDIIDVDASHGKVMIIERKNEQ